MSDPESGRERAWPMLPRTSPLTVRSRESRPAEPAPELEPEPAPAADPLPARPQAASPPPPQPRPAQERLRPRAPVVALSMSERARFIVATLFGLVLAIGVHLVIVLALPRFAEQDAFSRLRGTMESRTAVLIAGPGGAETWMPLPDPAAAVAACAYDLEDGPVRIAARTGALLQSLAFHARGGGVFYAVTDRAAVRGELDLVVMTRRQLDEILAAEDEDEPTRDVRIVAPRAQGFVIMRAVAPLPSQRTEAEAAVKAVACTIETDEEEAPPQAQPAPAPGRR